MAMIGNSSGFLWRRDPTGLYHQAMKSLLRSLVALGLTAFTASALVPMVSAQAAIAPVKGIAILVDNQTSFSDSAALTQARSLFSYVKSLKATGVQLDFPISTPSVTSNTLSASTQAPSPKRLASIISLARSQGLNVQVRPLLDESTLAPTYFRGDLAPSNLTLWFSNYFNVLRPYLVTAKSSGVQSFSIGSELTNLYENPYPNATVARNQALWAKLIKSVKKVYSGTLIVAHNFNGLTPVANTKFGFDAYGPVTSLDDSASVSALTSAIQNNWTQGASFSKYYTSIQSPFSADYVEEVGISAVSGMYATPWKTSFTNPTIDRSIQANWFAANCNAFFNLKMAGIYFWMVSFPGYSLTRDMSQDPANWYNTSADTAIKNCFARTR